MKLHSFILLLFTNILTCHAYLHCNVEGTYTEVPFTGTPIWSAFNQTSNRTECIIACMSYPECVPNKPTVNSTTKVCDAELNNPTYTWQRGFGWEMQENRDRNFFKDKPCMDLPICVQGFIIKKCSNGYCLSEKTDCYCSRYTHNQQCTEVELPITCTELKLRYPEFKSGWYLLKPGMKSFPFYCDLETDGGGWMSIMNVSGHAINPSGHMVKDYRYQIQGNSVAAFATLKKYIDNFNMTQLRFYCYKKSVGRTIDIATTKDAKGRAVINFLFNNTIIYPQPESCGSYYRLPGDTSRLTLDCNNFKEGKWGVTMHNQWFQRPMEADGHNYVIAYALSGDYRWSCDDPVLNSDKDGHWMVYVR